MVMTDEDALICDLAETYGIYNYEELPPIRAAVLACGLRANARIMAALSDAARGDSEKQYETAESGEEYMAMRRMLMKEANNGNTSR